jgi:hypothetical protein
VTTLSRSLSDSRCQRGVVVDFFAVTVPGGVELANQGDPVIERCFGRVRL